MKSLSGQSALRLAAVFLTLVPSVALDGRGATSSDDTFFDDGNSCKTITEISCTTNSFTTLCDALDKTGLDVRLNNWQPTGFTVFAPTNAAFNQVFEDLDYDDIHDFPVDALTDLLETHIHDDDIIFGPELSTRCGTLLEMTSGENTRTVCEDNGNTIFQKGTGNTDENIPKIVSFNNDACNGVVHTIDEMILPSNFATNDPTRDPTRTPTHHPQSDPTMNPTRQPTPHPGPDPTSNPTRKPTPHPGPDPTSNPTRKPTPHPGPSPTRNPTKKPTPYPVPSPTRNPTKRPTIHPALDSASCSAFPRCEELGLTGNCCPTNDDKTLGCCSHDNPTHLPTYSPIYSPTHNPTQKPTSQSVEKPEGSCSLFPKCAEIGLEGICCPSDGEKLECCFDEGKPIGPDDTCSTYPKCDLLGLKGDCCPEDDVEQLDWLDCCFDEVPGTCSRHPGCVAEGLEGECCPSAGGFDLDCCDKQDNGEPIVDVNYCEDHVDFSCYEYGVPECCLKSSKVCPKEKPRCEVGFPITGESYCTFAPLYGCYENGYPKCCEGHPDECPDHRPACDTARTIGYNYCSKSPDFTCYDYGYPSCCFEENADNCSYERPSCNVGKRGCDLEDSLPSIFDFACQLPNFDILCELLEEAEIEKVLEDENDTFFTFFAPSNEAFECLDDATVTALLEDPTGALQDILKYHLSDKIYFREDFFCERKIDTLRGDTSDDFITTTCSYGELFQKGQGNHPDELPKIIATDIITCDGVIHVIDKVLLPKE